MSSESENFVNQMAALESAGLDLILRDKYRQETALQAYRTAVHQGAEPRIKEIIKSLKDRGYHVSASLSREVGQPQTMTFKLDYDMTSDAGSTWSLVYDPAAQAAVMTNSRNNTSVTIPMLSENPEHAPSDEIVSSLKNFVTMFFRDVSKHGRVKRVRL